MVGFYCYASYFAYLPLGLWMGIANLTTFLVPGPLWLAAALLSLRVAYHPHPQGKMPFSLIVVSSLAVASMALIFGPLILLPSVAVVNTIAFMMNRDRTRRPFILACGVFSVLLPLALENAGVLPVSYAFGNDIFMVFASAVHFPPAPTRAFLLITNLGVIVVSAVLIAKMRDLLTAKEQQTFLHSWQLRQLVPEEASGPVEMPLPPEPACAILPPR
jgi:serine/threonine-protein kinase